MKLSGGDVFRTSQPMPCPACGIERRTFVQRPGKPPRCILCEAFPFRKSRNARASAGFALIMEMLIVTAVLLIMAAVAIPNLVQIRAGANQQEARGRVMQVWNANAAISICAGTPGCIPNPPLANLIPQPGTVQSFGYTFTYSQTGSGWNYTAAPIQPGITGHFTYSASQNGFACTQQGGQPC